MPTTKEILWAILAITVASAVVMIAVAPLDGSAYADGVRETLTAAAQSSESEMVDEGGGLATTMTQLIMGDARSEGATTPLSFMLMIVGSVLRLATLMGVTGGMTLAVLAINSRITKRPRPSAG